MWATGKEGVSNGVMLIIGVHTRGFMKNALLTQSRTVYALCIIPGSNKPESVNLCSTTIASLSSLDNICSPRLHGNAKGEEVLKAEVP